MQIATIEDLISSSAALLNKEIKIEDLSLSDDFVCRITISGENQQGLVDYGLASFVVLLQKNARSIIRSCAKDLPPNEQKKISSQVEVKVKVNEGSTIIDILLESIFGGALQNMTGDQILYAIVILCSTMFGLKGLSVLSEIKNKAKDEETKQRFAAIAEKLIEEMPKMNEPMRALAKSLSAKDTVKLEAMDEPLEKNDYRAHFKNIKIEGTQTIYIDDHYTVNSVSLDKLYIRVEKGRAKFSASTRMLNDESKKKLFSEVKDAGIKDTTASLDLQINLIIEGLEKEYYVMGLGNPRPGTADVETVVAKSVEDLLSESPKQASLF